MSRRAGHPDTCHAAYSVLILDPTVPPASVQCMSFVSCSVLKQPVGACVADDGGVTLVSLKFV